jgi:hypothetical protein
VSAIALELEASRYIVRSWLQAAGIELKLSDLVWWRGDRGDR